MNAAINCNYYYTWHIPADDPTVMEFNLVTERMGSGTNWAAIGLSNSGYMVGFVFT